MISKTIQRHLIGLSFIICPLSFISCENIVTYNDNYTPKDQIANTGAPVISAVYDVADAALSTPITAGAPGQTVCIVGQNLNSLRALSFNTVEVPLADTYTMSTKAIVKIPTAYSRNATNTIEYTTDKGTTSYAFVVQLPELRVWNLNNEFQADGTDVSISGENFDYYGFGETDAPASVTVAGQSATLSFVSPKMLRVRIPEGTPANTAIAVNWQNAAGEACTISLPFRPTDGLLFADLSRVQRDKTDVAATIERDADVTSTKSQLGTPHIHVCGALQAWSWLELSFSQNLPDVYDASRVGDYNFVFEVLTESGHPLPATGFDLAWNWQWEQSYRWLPLDGNQWDTGGEWTTVRLPLSEVAPQGIGTPGQWMTFNFGFQPVEAYDADFRMGNFRIQKK